MANEAMAEKLKALRGQRTQREVAEALGISLSAYAMYESGARVPRDEVKIRIAKYYNRSVKFLFFADDAHRE